MRSNPVKPLLQVNDCVTVKVAPASGPIRNHMNETGRITKIENSQFVMIATVQFESGPALEIPLPYLQPVPKETVKATRRPPLYLHEPKDERSEAQRMADGLAFIERFGYETLRVGQGRAAAICHKCSRESRDRGGPHFIRIQCKDCGSQGYAPSTNSTEGTPDSFVWHPRWPAWTMLPVEWKDGPKGKRSPEQAALESAKRIVVAFDTPSLCWFIAEFEDRTLKLAVLPEIEAEGDIHQARINSEKGPV